MNALISPHDEHYVNKVQELIGEEGFAQVFRDVTQAQGLPNEAYWSQAWFDLEQERIFRRNWVYAGQRPKSHKLAA
ncbi:MAG: hypothetical protein AAF614_40535 [Chloroflexota bacterium]